MKEFIHIIGKRGTMHDDRGVQWDVYIKDVRRSYGRVDYLISPASGEGQTWVSSDRVEVEQSR